MEEMFIQTDEQRAILESVRRFVAEVVNPGDTVQEGAKVNPVLLREKKRPA